LQDRRDFFEVIKFKDLNCRLTFRAHAASIHTPIIPDIEVGVFVLEKAIWTVAALPETPVEIHPSPTFPASARYFSW
jgi:hypothetical protein